MLHVTTLARRVFAGAIVSLALGASAQATEVTGAGSTFIQPVLSRWSTDYNQATGVKVNYQSLGSAAGVAQVKAATVDFGASDVPLPSQDLTSLGLGQFPAVIGGVVPIVNIAGLQSGQLKFTGPLLADIFLGRVTRWNDPAIVAINPDIKLPNAKILVVHRSDGSGTTFNWLRYLSSESAAWKTNVGEGMSVAWPVGVGGKGSEGVAAYVRQMPNSIGYVEYAYVKQNKMTFGLIKNKAGKFVMPGANSFRAAATAFDWTKAKDFNVVMTDAPGEEAYPVTAATFIIMRKEPKNTVPGKETRAFFRWSLEHGQSQASDLDYVPLPADLVKAIENYWAANF